MSINDRLAEIEAVAAWLDDKDMEPEVYAATAAIRAVIDLHKPVEVEPSDTICRECSYQLSNGRYFGKVEEWPCPTVRAVENALGEVGQ